MTEAELERLVVRLVGDATEYQKMIDQAIAETRRAGAAMTAESRRVDAYAISIRTLGGTVGNLAAQMRAMTALESPFGMFREGIHLAAEAEKNAAAFGVMLQSVQKGLKLEKDIIKFGAETPLQANGIQAAAKMLLQFNAVNEDSVIPTLRMLGDVTGGDQQRLMQMSLAFGQASSTGRLMGQDLLQMINAGFNPLQEIARTTGKTVSELKEEMEKGKITIDMVKEAFRTATSEGGNFKNGMQAASKTFEGLASTMQDDLASMKRAIGAFIIEEFRLKDALKSVSAEAQTFTKWFNELNPVVKETGIVLTIAAGSVGAFVVAWKVGQVAMLMTVGTLTNMRATIVSVIAGVKWYIAALRGQTVAQVQATAGLAAMAGVQYNASAAMQMATVRARTLSTAMLGLKLALAGVAAYATIKVAEMAPVNQERIRQYQASLEQVQRDQARRTSGASSANDAFFSSLSGSSAGERKAALEAELKKHTENSGVLGEAPKLEQTQDSVTAAQERLNELRGNGFAIISKLLPVETAIEAKIKEQEEALKGATDRYEQELAHVQKLKDELEKLKDPVNDPAIVKAVKDYTSQLEVQAETFGMTGDEIKIYELRKIGATDAMLANAKALQKVNAELVSTKQKEEQAALARSRDQDKLDDLTASLERELDTMGMTAKEVELYNLSMLGLDDTMTSYARTLIETKAHAMEHHRLVEEGKSLTERYLNPLEKFSKESANLNKLLEEGAISRETYERAMSDAANTLERTEEGARGARKEMERLDAVLAGGAEAKFRIASFMESNRESRNVMDPTASQNKIIARGGSSLSSQTGKDEDQTKILGDIRKLLADQKKKQILVKEAGVS